MDEIDYNLFSNSNKLEYFLKNNTVTSDALNYYLCLAIKYYENEQDLLNIKLLNKKF